MPELINKAAFAKRLGVHRAYVTHLDQAGRLVMDETGKVNVAASLRRIEETADPNRDDVRRRHAETRQQKAAAPSAGPPKPHEPEDPEVKKVSRGFNAARAEKEHYLAQTAKLEWERAVGKMVDATVVRSSAAGAGAALRAALENLPDQLAPLLAPIVDEDEVRRLLDDHMELVLAQLAEKFMAAKYENHEN